ncbi:MAG: hypothetical protein L0Z46_04810 [Nitrospiraceae bacterium]|nr:hypothetical protein [Nitrospiraceae bacterium]
MQIFVGVLFLMLCLGLSDLALTQLPLGGQNQADILKLHNELPPETMKKIEALGKILQQNLKEGKLTEAQLHEELMSGNLEQKLRGLNPEAGPLLDDIADAMKDHSNADSLPNLLNGLVGDGR